MALVPTGAPRDAGAFLLAHLLAPALGLLVTEKRPLSSYYNRSF